MDFFAQIEIQGIASRVEKIEGPKKAFVQFSVLVEEAFTNKAGDSIIDTQWFNCMGMDLNVESGDKVHIIGKVRTIKYTGGEGEIHHSWQVCVEKLEKL